MYTRVSRGKVKPGKTDEVKALLAKLKVATHELPGVAYWMAFLSNDGELTIISAFADKKSCDESGHINAQRWKDAGHLIEGEPAVSYGEMVEFGKFAAAR